MKKVFIFVVLGIVSVLCILLLSERQAYQYHLPTLTDERITHSGWALTGDMYEIYGNVASVQEFHVKEWQQIDIEKPELSEFAPALAHYCETYSAADKSLLFFFEKETDNNTLRAIVNRQTGETYIRIFGR